MGFLKLGKEGWARTNPTKEGMVFLALSLFVGFAALNTGNNLLYLAFGMMMSFIVASGVMSMINLSRIEVIALAPGDTYAGSQSRLKFIIKNNKPIIPSYSMSLELGGKKVLVPYVKARSESQIALSYIFHERGWNDIPEARLSTRFPFGFFKKWIRLDTGEDKVLAYPRLKDISITDIDIKRNGEEIKYDQEGMLKERAGSGDDIRSLREYSEGDNPKLIHWKTTAKSGKIMVRENEDEGEDKEAVLRFIPPADSKKLETQISSVAGVFVELRRKGFDIEFRAPDKVLTSDQIGRFPGAVLTYLALYKA